MKYVKSQQILRKYFSDMVLCVAEQISFDIETWYGYRFIAFSMHDLF